MSTQFIASPILALIPSPYFSNPLFYCLFLRITLLPFFFRPFPSPLRVPCIYRYFIYIYTCIHIYIHTRTRICIRKYIYIYAYVYIYAHTYIYIYTQGTRRGAQGHGTRERAGNPAARSLLCGAGAHVQTYIPYPEVRMCQHT